jgi:hypothetical protein
MIRFPIAEPEDTTEVSKGPEIPDRGERSSPRGGEASATTFDAHRAASKVYL